MNGPLHDKVLQTGIPAAACSTLQEQSLQNMQLHRSNDEQCSAMMPAHCLCWTCRYVHCSGARLCSVYPCKQHANAHVTRGTHQSMYSLPVTRVTTAQQRRLYTPQARSSKPLDSHQQRARRSPIFPEPHLPTLPTRTLSATACRGGATASTTALAAALETLSLLHMLEAFVSTAAPHHRRPADRSHAPPPTPSDCSARSLFSYARQPCPPTTAAPLALQQPPHTLVNAPGNPSACRIRRRGRPQRAIIACTRGA